MANKGILSSIRSKARDADELFFLFTGKRFRHVAARGWELFGEDVTEAIGKKFAGRKGEDDWDYLTPDNPYRTLGVEPDAMDLVVKGAFRSLVREYHPDTGINPDPTKFQKVVESYNAIMEARALDRQGKK